ncbi:hypothetical protein BD560DRAFT_370586 [Blakeslea trispora]|nr:hypothetical protein BD560DRAFT_370586 [Blakeslea trispora]
MSASKDSFPLFNEKRFANNIKLISCCPTSDLTLVVTATDRLVLYRSGTELVWTLDNRFESAIKITAWNPNGKEFVVGCEDGTVHRVDIRGRSPTVSIC